jgi:hypothetical protein
MKHLQVHMETSTTPRGGVLGRWIKAPLAAGVMVSGLLLSGCSTLMCAGTGTCVDHTMSYRTPTTKGQFTPQTVMLNGQSIIIVPEYSSNRTQAILIPGK